MTTSILLSNPLSPHLQLLKSEFPPRSPSKLPPFRLKTAVKRRGSVEVRLQNGPPKLIKFLSAPKVAEIEPQAAEDPLPLVGEDSAQFVLSQQKISSWVYFSVILGVVLYVLDVAWIDNSTGFGKVFIDALSAFSGSPEVVMLLLTLIFAVVHSGLASLRDTGEKVIGERAFRVLFAGISLPLAVSTVVYFINHRYDGVQLWQLQSVPGLHEFLWFANFISFLLLYPSTFNLLEVAAVDKPKMHLWETGIMRITRHPQMVGQVIWCLAHTVWIGNSVAVAASLGLIGHHLFGVWNGDRRLSIRYGEAFEVVKKRTSVVPFAAILDGRQKLPESYYKEFLRLPYLSITVLTLGTYFAHPLMQAAKRMSKDIIFVYCNGDWTDDVTYEGYHVCGVFHKENEDLEDLKEAIKKMMEINSSERLLKLQYQIKEGVKPITLSNEMSLEIYKELRKKKQISRNSLCVQLWKPSKHLL
ncbi:15-cis-zeta-carotene isomerase [Striga asiatica]|uniref:15-cis-zeta-carotene isomerase n=1 Tax=Striga asiatica TaxID=4170 RepID=A0A5A7PK53_STRAF|nr:15-cis-zeta-carotene isomerase [Striga asiatica]